MSIIKFFSRLLLLCVSLNAIAHPAPNSILIVDVRESVIDAELHLPIPELQLAVPFKISNDVTNLHSELEKYVQSHVAFTDVSGQYWKLEVLTLNIETTGNKAVGIIKEIVVQLRLLPPPGAEVRHFIIRYNAIMDKVINHRALVYVRQDWEKGRVDKNHEEVGVISINTATMKIEPLTIDLKEGSKWTGFQAMIRLGMKHISEGTDHLMFLLALLLTAPLFYNNRRWEAQPVISRSIVKILKISFSFTIGHSLTLAFASLGWIRIPSQPVEIIIALSIIVTAFHVLKPIFPNGETLVAAAFGLVHGLAFSTVLSEMHLGSGQLVLSLLGFNIGIEIMQLIAIFLVMPWLLFLSRYSIYKILKNIIAVIAIAMALAWMAERITGTEILLANFVKAIASNAILFVVVLFILSLYCYLSKKQIN